MSIEQNFINTAQLVSKAKIIVIKSIKYFKIRIKG